MLTTILLTLITGALAAPSYQDDKTGNQVIRENSGRLRFVTNFDSGDNDVPLTGEDGIDLEDFYSAPPRKSGPFLDAALIALEMSNHNWPLARILTTTGGVDVDKATVAFSSDNGAIPPLEVPVHRGDASGCGTWWIQAYDQAAVEARNKNYGADYLSLLTGYPTDSLGTYKWSHRMWTKAVTESVRAKSPIIIGTHDASQVNGTLKAGHAYAVEAITNGPENPNPLNPYTIETITLRDAETATQGVTYKWDDLQISMNYFLYLEPKHDGPGEDAPGGN